MVNVFVRAFLLAEDYIVARILRSPSWHNFVRGIHRRVQDYRYGRNPNEPLRQGEATEIPGSNNKSSGFVRYFVEELRNQARGTPTEVPPPPSKPSTERRWGRR